LYGNILQLIRVGANCHPLTFQKGGRISGNARRALEKQTGKKVVSGQNFLPRSKQVKQLK
jgi:hypothetical protein